MDKKFIIGEIKDNKVGDIITTRLHSSHTVHATNDLNSLLRAEDNLRKRKEINKRLLKIVSED